jgi:hypothetical protein
MNNQINILMFQDKRYGPSAEFWIAADLDHDYRGEGATQEDALEDLFTILQNATALAADYVDPQDGTLNWEWGCYEHGTLLRTEKWTIKGVVYESKIVLSNYKDEEI